MKRFYELVEELNLQMELEAQRQVVQQRVVRQAGQHSRSGGVGR